MFLEFTNCNNYCEDCSVALLPEPTLAYCLMDVTLFCVTSTNTFTMCCVKMWAQEIRKATMEVESDKANARGDAANESCCRWLPCIRHPMITVSTCAHTQRYINNLDYQ
eukprot:199291-Amphidinium_carterae.1